MRLVAALLFPASRLDCPAVRESGLEVNFFINFSVLSQLQYGCCFVCLLIRCCCYLPLLVMSETSKADYNSSC